MVGSIGLVRRDARRYLTAGKGGEHLYVPLDRHSPLEVKTSHNLSSNASAL